MGKYSAVSFLAVLAQPVWSRNLEKALHRAEGLPSGQLAEDEDFWYAIQQAFTVSPGLINLNNGAVSPSPKVVQDAVKRYMDMSNEAPSYYMLRVLDQGRESIRRDLAGLAGCSPDEIAIQRNTSEALETVIFGLNLKAGDEVVVCKQDYPNMLNAWKQRAARDGIKLVWVNLELPSEDEDYLAGQYVQAFTPRTKLVQITHVINWNGQHLPVRKIADAAHGRGIEVMVDGAHSFAQLPYSIPSLNCDYFGTSLHKWLTSCIGSGVLYVRKEKIAGLYPLFSAPEPQSDDIRKFEHQGTKPDFIELAIGKAIEFHQMIGIERKAQRLHYLKNYWMTAVKDLPKVKLHTSLKPEWGGAIGMISVEGKTTKELDEFFWRDYKIHTVAIDWENIHGVRITPNVYTMKRELDVLIGAIRKFATT